MSEIQNVVDAFLAIKNTLDRENVINQLQQLIASASEEKILENESNQHKEITDVMKGNDIEETSHYFVHQDTSSNEFADKISSIKTVDLVFTSPPYNAKIEYDSYNDNIPIDDYLSFLSTCISNVDKVLNPGGRFVINIRDIAIGTGKRFPIIVHLYERFCKLMNYNYRGVYIWYKGREESSFAWGSYKSSSNPAIIDLFEYIFVFQKPGDRKDGTDDIEKTDFIENVLGVWKIRPVKKIIGSEKNNIAEHPCPFPPELARRIIKLYSHVGDWVLDPFGGIGNTSAGAIFAGRNSISVDVSGVYTSLAYKKIKRQFRPLYSLNTLQLHLIK